MALQRASPSLEQLSAELGMPDSYGFYYAIDRIARNIAESTKDSVVVTSSDTVNLLGAGTLTSPLRASLADGAIGSTDDSIVVTVNEDGTLDLSVVGEENELFTEDSATISLEGSGTEASPLSATLTSGAIISSGGSIAVVEGPDGVVDLSVVAVPSQIETTSTESIFLSGDGSPGSPLSATLGPQAITSPDGSISVTQVGGGAFQLEALGATPDIVSTDTITLSGDGSLATPLRADLAPGALTSPDSSVTITSLPGGALALSVLASLPTLIPRTVVVGDGSLGSTPSSTTMAGALALLPTSITVDEPWTLLFLPGTHTGPLGGTLGANVNLTALLPGSAIVDVSDLLYSDLTGDESSVTVSGLRFTNSFGWNVTGKAGSTSSLRVNDCIFEGPLDIRMRPIPVNVSLAVLKQDQVVINTSQVDGSLSARGGYALLSSCRVTETSTALLQPQSDYAYFQVQGGSFSPLSLGTLTRQIITVENAAIGGSWVITGADSLLTVIGCDPVGDGDSIGRNITGLNPWRIGVTSAARVNIYETPLTSTLTPVTSSTFTYRENCIIPAQVDGTIDRDILIAIGTAASSASAPTITITLSPPLATDYNSSLGSTTRISALSVDSTGPNRVYRASPGSTSQVVLQNTTNGSEGITVSIQVPKLRLTSWVP